MEWIKAPEANRKLVMWMYGPAGSGKTAIAQSIAEECKSLGLLAASFFFARTAPGRNDAMRFIATIAYQISRFIPEVEDHLLTPIECDPTIFSRKLSTQMEALIIEPLRLLPSLSLRPIFVILDGVDECGPHSQSPSDLLNVLGSAISELQHLPLMFLIASRPEYEIRQAFSGNILGPFVYSIVLDDTYKPDEDIRVYFDSKFQEIRDRQLTLGSHLSSPWPTGSDVDSLVAKASGQFIFAATVIKFIDSPRHHPAQRLDVILGLSIPGNETPFALLDELYRYILTSVSDLPKVLEILTLLILGSNYEHDLDTYNLKLGVWLIEELMEIDVRRVLMDLHALVFIPPPTDDKSALRMHHASLYDFLVDKSRSRELYINVDAGHALLFRRWLKMAATHCTSEQVTFAGIFRGILYHCFQTKSDISADFACFDLKAALEAIKDMDDLHRPLWLSFFQNAERKGNNRSDAFPRLLYEFDTFVLSRLAQYPSSLQACIPALFALERGDYSIASVFRLVLAGTAHSQAEFDEHRQLDAKLLGLYDQRTSPNAALKSLFCDRKRAGGYYAGDRLGYARVAKLAARVMFPKTENEFDSSLLPSEPSNAENVPSPTFRTWVREARYDWFTTLLCEGPLDRELAMFLRDFAAQYGEDVEPIKYSKLIAKASMSYVRRSEIPYLKHAHVPNLKRCMICGDSMGVSVVPINQLDPDASDVQVGGFPLMSQSEPGILPTAGKSAPSVLLNASPASKLTSPGNDVVVAGETREKKKRRSIVQGLLKRILHLRQGIR